MSLNQCLRQTTHRQFIAWVWKLDQEWEHPSPTDYYLMQIAAEIRIFRYGFSSTNQSVSLSDFKLKPVGQDVKILDAEAEKVADEIEIAIIESNWKTRGFNLVKVEDEAE